MLDASIEISICQSYLHNSRFSSLNLNCQMNKSLKAVTHVFTFSIKGFTDGEACSKCAKSMNSTTEKGYTCEKKLCGKSLIAAAVELEGGSGDVSSR